MTLSFSFTCKRYFEKKISSWEEIFNITETLELRGLHKSISIWTTVQLTQEWPSLMDEHSTLVLSLSPSHRWAHRRSHTFNRKFFSRNMLKIRKYSFYGVIRTTDWDVLGKKFYFGIANFFFFLEARWAAENSLKTMQLNKLPCFYF